MKNYSIKLQLWRKIAPLIIILLVGLFAAVSSSAQHRISAGFGANSYIGELSPDRGNAQINGSIYYHRYLEERVFVKGGLNFGRIEGSFELGDEFDGRNLVDEPINFFSADIFSGDVSFNVEVIRLNFAYFYGGIGFGVLNFNLEDSEGRNLEDRPSTRLDNEDFSTTIAQVPINTGIILFPENRINLILEQSWILTNSDYLDNIGYTGREGSDSIIRRSLNIRYKF